jgi:hypothetical protein
LCEVNEQAVLDHTGDGGEAPGQQLRLDDSLERGIKDPIAGIRDESMVIFVRRGSAGPGAPADAAAASTARRVAASPNGTTSTGSGYRPSTETHFDRSAITTRAADAEATIFSRSKAPPPPLIRLRSGAISSAPSTVSSSAGVSSSVVRGDAQRSRLFLSCRRAGDHDDREAGPHALTQHLDEIARRRAGAEPKPHARAHEIKRALGCGAFLPFHVHRSQHSAWADGVDTGSAIPPPRRQEPVAEAPPEGHSLAFPAGVG